MESKKKKYHFIYKTTNLLNEKYYIGMHSTNDLSDGYIGIGKRLWYSIKKYGIENFKTEILEFQPNRTQLKNREREIVTKELIIDINCMNLKQGGYGGLCDDNHARKFHSAGGTAVRLMFCKIHHEKFKNDIEYREKCINKIKGNTNWLGKKHKDESKRKIGFANSIKQKGENNSQYGTCWITNGFENKKIKKDDCYKYEQTGWRPGPIIK